MGTRTGTIPRVKKWDGLTGTHVALWLYLTALADIATTAVGIQVFGLVEMNGIPALLIDELGVWAVVPPKAIVTGVALFVYLWSRESEIPLSAYSGAFLAMLAGGLSLVAALWNVSLMVAA